MQTLIVKTRKHASTHPDLETLGRLLADGQLVVFPTETVYGIAAHRDSPDALERLRTLKGRPANRPLTVHLADNDALARLAAPVHPFAARIVRRLWPGPLTLVLPDRDGSHTGFRLPDCEIARALFRAAGVDLVATSANTTGESPLVSPRQVVKRFSGRVAGILSSGKTAFAGPSTVARLDGRTMTILRAGVIPETVIREAGRYDVLFVCTGNLCRSPMGEAMLKSRLAGRLEVAASELFHLGFRIHSAGTAGIIGAPATPDARLAVMPFHADLRKHLSRALTPALIDSADVIYTAEKAHADLIVDLWPSAAGKIRPMAADGADVPDPYGCSGDDYQEVAGRIENALEAIVERTISKSGLIDS